MLTVLIWAVDYIVDILDKIAYTIIMFALSATIIEIFVVEMCMTLIFTFRMSKGKCKYKKRKPICDFLFVDNSNVFSMCRSLRENHIWTFQFTSFEYFTLKMNMNDVHNFGENYFANVISARIGTSRLSRLYQMSRCHFVDSGVANNF